jgi:hypothetical protein
MSVGKVTLNFNLPKSLWTAKDSARLASDTLAAIKIRTSKGIDANGTPFDGYSTKPIYVSKRGARLSPKGGELTPSGRSVYYEGGYKQYKHESRRRSELAGTAEVDLVLSGNMLNNLVVTGATADGFTIGLTQHAGYGYYVNETREFLGLSQRDVDILVEAVRINLEKKIK